MGVWGPLPGKTTAFHAGVTPPARARKSRVMSRVILTKGNVCRIARAKFTLATCLRLEAVGSSRRRYARAAVICQIRY